MWRHNDFQLPWSFSELIVLVLTGCCTALVKSCWRVAMTVTVGMNTMTLAISIAQIEYPVACVAWLGVKITTAWLGVKIPACSVMTLSCTLMLTMSVALHGLLTMILI
jgi:hypothetical protein